MMKWSGGDWLCGACQHQNFKKREACQLCGYPKFGSSAAYDRTSSINSNNINNNNNNPRNIISGDHQAPVVVLAGDWYCTGMNSCGAHNFASRETCYRCGALKYDYHGHDHLISISNNNNVMVSDHDHHLGLGADLPPGWKPGDWLCTRNGCGVHNYACRTECFKCNTPKQQLLDPYGSMEKTL